MRADSEIGKFDCNECDTLAVIKLNGYEVYGMPETAPALLLPSYLLLPLWIFAEQMGLSLRFRSCLPWERSLQRMAETSGL